MVGWFLKFKLAETKKVPIIWDFFLLISWVYQTQVPVAPAGSDV